MQKYRAKLKHDHGTTWIVIWARSLESAIERIMNLEHCPRRAITEIKEGT